MFQSIFVNDQLLSLAKYGVINFQIFSIMYARTAENSYTYQRERESMCVSWIKQQFLCFTGKMIIFENITHNE